MSPPEAGSPAPPEVVGIVPAGGRATRLGSLPCSKEIFPIGFTATPEGKQRPRAACEYLLEPMRRAGVRRVYVVLRPGKWDIPAFLGDGSPLGLQLAYLLQGLPHGTPFTLDQAYPFVRGDRVAFGFPDILFHPEDAFTPLLDRLDAGEAEVVLGLFETTRPEKMDMVEVDGRGRVRAIDIKPATTSLRHTWVLAVWNPAFTEFMHAYLARRAPDFEDPAAGGPVELFVGHVFQAALADGMPIEAVPFGDGWCADVGTPEELCEAVGSRAVSHPMYSPSQLTAP